MIEDVDFPLSWTCHVCGDVRADEDIAVHVEQAPFGRAAAEVRIRYCVDRPECRVGAEQMAVDFARRHFDGPSSLPGQREPQ